MVDEEISLDGRFRHGARRRRAETVIFRIVIDAEIGRRFVFNIRTVRQQHDLVELQPAFKQVLDLLVVDNRGIRRDPGIQKFNFLGPFASRALEHAGERIVEGHSDALGKGIAYQQNPVRARFQRHIADRGILEAEIVGDQPVARLAPDVVAVEIGGKAVIIDGVVDARAALALLSHGEGRIEQIEAEEQCEAVKNHQRVEEEALWREIGRERGPRARSETVRHLFFHSQPAASMDGPNRAETGKKTGDLPMHT